jgi:acyl carrier protein
MATTLERLIRIIAEQLGVDEESISPSSSFAFDLNVDSNDLAELIPAIEEEFSSPKNKVEIPVEDAGMFRTVQDVIEYLNDLL